MMLVFGLIFVCYLVDLLSFFRSSPEQVKQVHIGAVDCLGAHKPTHSAADERVAGCCCTISKISVPDSWSWVFAILSRK